MYPSNFNIIQKPYYNKTNYTVMQKRHVNQINQVKPVTFDDYLKIVMILDESGSMNTIRNQMINSINDLIMEQKQVKERPTTFTLVKFSDNVKEIIVNKSLSNVNNVTEYDYTPSGSTALYDAIGKTIERFRNEKDVLMVIVTDGQENASKTYTKNQINKMINEKKTNNNWSYVYLSCDLSTELQGNNIGLNTSAYASNCQVNKNHYGSFIGNNLNSAITNYRKNGISIQSQI